MTEDSKFTFSKWAYCEKKKEYFLLKNHYGKSDISLFHKGVIYLIYVFKEYKGGSNAMR